jgi:hypothetical protein
MYAYSVVSHQFNQLSTIALAGNQDAGAITCFGNDIFVYITNKGLVRYHLDFDGTDYSFSEINTYTLINGAPDFMAADSFGLYLGYRTKGLFAYNRQTLMQTGWYPGGLDFRGYTQQYGIQDLFCRDSLVVLVEYHSQTSLLTNYNDYLAIKRSASSEDLMYRIYPNPFSTSTILELNSDFSGKTGTADIYDAEGNKVGTFHVSGNSTTLYRGFLTAGIYFFRISDGEKVLNGKFIIF